MNEYAAGVPRYAADRVRLLRRLRQRDYEAEHAAAVLELRRRASARERAARLVRANQVLLSRMPVCPYRGRALYVFTDFGRTIRDPAKAGKRVIGAGATCGEGNGWDNIIRTIEEYPAGVS